ncbi:hypothetical protein GCM10027423_26390 [Spirosoma arcticum]
MVILAGLIWLPRPAIAAFALVLIAGHNLLDVIQPESANAWWTLLHKQGVFRLNGKLPVFVAYPLIPWLGIMASGYWLGTVFTQSASLRNRWLLRAGGLLLLAFVGLRFLNLYGDPRSWTVQPRGVIYTLFSVVNVTKYPPSLLYTCLMLGLALLLLARIDRVQGGLRQVLLVYGRVPFFFYIGHILLLHTGAALWKYGQYGRVLNLMFDKPDTWPAAYSPNLGRLYAVWLAMLVVMYYVCRWYGGIKRRYAYPWLSYL